MRIAVISDLHLGAGDASDAFGHDEGEFLRFLGFLERNFERIVLLGDIWETLTSRRYGNAAAELRRAREAHLSIARRFTRRKYLYVHGNHDLVAGVVEHAPEELTIRADRMRLLFTHGHQNDGLLHRARWVSELGVWLGGWIRRFGLGPLYRLANRIDHLRGGHSVDACSPDFQRWAIEAARIRSADVVVTGHTHTATRAEHGGTLFLNSGACSQGNYSFSSIDTRRGEYGIHERW